MSRLLLASASLFALIGCTHTQLRYNTVNQAKTVADVHTQQVLNNLAKFVHDPYSLPHFSYPNSGLAQVTDNASTGARLNFGTNALTSWFYDLNGSRTSAESYTLTPINDPKKLELMRCAYQRAIARCNCSNESTHCPDCTSRFNRFYLGSETITKTGKLTPDGSNVFRVNEDVKLIYYEGDFYYELDKSPLNARFVMAERSDTNEVIYRYFDGPDFDQVIFGTKLYKLEEKTAKEREVGLFIELLLQDPELQRVVQIEFGGKQITLETLVANYFGSDVKIAGNQLLKSDSQGRQAELKERVPTNPTFGNNVETTTTHYRPQISSGFTLTIH